MGLNYVRKVIADARCPVDIYAALRPLLLVCFLNGISPFKIAGTLGNRRLVVTGFGFAFTLFYLLWFCTSCVLRVVNQPSIVSIFFSSKVSRLVDTIRITTTFVGIGLTLIMCFLKRNKLRKLIHVLAQIDKRFIALGVKINYKNISRNVCAIVVLQWSIEVTYVGVLYVLFRSLERLPTIFVWMYFVLPFVIVMTLKSKFVCMMNVIRNQFRRINITLNKLQMDAGEIRWNGYLFCVNGKKDKMEEREKYDIIAELCRIHEQICDACNLAEAYFKYQMLLMVTFEFVMTIFNLYLVFDLAYNKNHIAGINPADIYVYFTFYTTITTGTLSGLLQSAASVRGEVSSNEG